jgi:DNA-directed RNA polymerase specialized sigma24 family protein
MTMRWACGGYSVNDGKSQTRQMNRYMPPRPFADLHALARRSARRIEEADDLLQSALLAAVEAGRTDLSLPQNRKWIAGVIRRRSAFDARTAARRRNRETAWASERDEHPASDMGGFDDLVSLSPALRTTGLLVMNGCTREEIGWLLRLPDTALRKRLSDLGKALRSRDAPGQPALAGGHAFGALRRALLAAVRRPGVMLASHDPDGHLFVVSRSQAPGSRQQLHVQTRRD